MNIFRFKRKMVLFSETLKHTNMPGHSQRHNIWPHLLPPRDTSWQSMLRMSILDPPTLCRWGVYDLVLPWCSHQQIGIDQVLHSLLELFKIRPAHAHTHQVTHKLKSNRQCSIILHRDLVRKLTLCSLSSCLILLPPIRDQKIDESLKDHQQMCPIKWG